MPRPLAATILAVWIATPGTVRAEKVLFPSGLFIVNCTTTTQLCEPPFTMQVGDPTERVKLKKIVYTASAGHCSAGRVHVELDGRKVGKMRFVISKERATLLLRGPGFRLAPGSHTMAFRFEGRPGGCNTGFVSGWGGEITITAKR
jgi:hypothetical protein